MMHMLASVLKSQRDEIRALKLQQRATTPSMHDEVVESFKAGAEKKALPLPKEL